MEIFSDIVHSVLQSFDFGYCVAVNVLTYTIIKLFDKKKSHPLNIWNKRIVLLISILILGTIYYFTDSDIKILVNSAILAPVSWSWIFKPLCAKFNIDYKQFNN